MSAPAIELKSITKSFPGVRCLDQVDFAVMAGEIHALLGENGAGKSSLTRVIGGAMAPDSGSINFEGDPVIWRSPRQARQAGVHVIHQELALFPDLSVAENMLIGNEPRRMFGLIDRPRMMKRAREVLARLDVAIDPAARTGNLSVADQQMVEIGKALMGELRLIVFDEPTAVISGREVESLFANMRRLKAAGVALVYISHRLEEIFQIADRVTVLKDGKYVGTRSVADIDRDTLIRMMVGRPLQDVFPKSAKRAAAAGPILSVRNFASGTKVRDVSFDLSPGEILGIAGMVGSGRTELAHALFGSSGHEAGQMLIDGKDAEPASPPLSIRRGIGFLTEDRKSEGLFLDLSVAANITAPALGAISGYGFIDRDAEKMIASEEIKTYAIAAPSAAARVINLSGGNQQKVLFSRWARIAGKVLILDEPTRGVDVGAKVEIYKIIRQLADRGIGILLISSELSEIIGMADRVLVMAEGRVTGEIPGSEASEESIMRLATVSHTAEAA
ncbi:sugar ABC transporter ATP-binding protein [soil metagenome]